MSVLLKQLKLTSVYGQVERLSKLSKTLLSLNLSV